MGRYEDMAHRRVMESPVAGTVTYKTRSGSSMDVVTGSVTHSSTSASVTAVVKPLSVETKARLGLGLQEADIRVLLLAEDVTSAVVGDAVVWEGDEYTVVAVDEAPSGAWLGVTCRKEQRPR